MGESWVKSPKSVIRLFTNLRTERRWALRRKTQLSSPGFRWAREFSRRGGPRRRWRRRGRRSRWRRWRRGPEDWVMEEDHDKCTSHLFSSWNLEIIFWKRSKFWSKYMFRVGHLVGELGSWLTLILAVPPSARFCLGWWEIGRTGWASGKDVETSQIKVNPTQLSDQMDLPVCVLFDYASYSF